MGDFGEKVGTGMVRFYLIVTNLVLILSGFSIFIVGTVLKASNTGGEFADAVSGYPNGETISDVASNAPVAAMAFGGLIFFVGLIGCVGGYRKNRCLLVLFCFILFVLCIAQFAAMIGAFIFANSSEGSGIDGNIKTTIDAVWSSNNTEIQWKIESLFECCGSTSAKDFAPDPAHITQTTCPDGWGAGCTSVIINTIKSNENKIGVGLLVAFLVQCLSICGSCCLFRHLNHERNMEMYGSKNPDKKRNDAQTMKHMNRIPDA